MKKVTVKAPATTANFVCGFDILGFAVHDPCDSMTVTITHNKCVTIRNEDGFNLPVDPKKNVAGKALLSILARLGDDTGFDIVSNKSIKPGSGIGSSAASATAAVVAANYLLDNRFSDTELIGFALDGEQLASGARHADNVAPCLYGGVTLVRSSQGPDIIRLPSPPLFVTIVHPQIEVQTAYARSILKKEIPLSDAVVQWGNVAGLVAGLMIPDFDLIARSMKDVVAEPARSKLIPAFSEIKARSLQCGAIGGGIAGSGPSMFMLSRDETTAREVELAMSEIYLSLGIDFLTYVTTISKRGAYVIESD